MNPRRDIDVLADWDGIDGPRVLGRPHVTQSRGKEVFSFEYDTDWLAGGFHTQLDPGPGLSAGAQSRMARAFRVATG